jgi:hypothetical protein
MWPLAHEAVYVALDIQSALPCDYSDQPPRDLSDRGTVHRGRWGGTGEPG